MSRVCVRQGFTDARTVCPVAVMTLGDVALAISPLTVACRTLSYFSQVANQPSRSRPYANLALLAAGAVGAAGGRTSDSAPSALGQLSVQKVSKNSREQRL